MNNSEPVNLASQATYLKVLEDTSENERAATIYVYPKSFRENSKFICIHEIIVAMQRS
jgi:hypothetical protein